MTERDISETNQDVSDLTDLLRSYDLLSQEELALMNQAADEILIDMAQGMRDVAPVSPDPEYELPV